MRNTAPSASHRTFNNKNSSVHKLKVKLLKIIPKEGKNSKRLCLFKRKMQPQINMNLLSFYQYGSSDILEMTTPNQNYINEEEFSDR